MKRRDFFKASAIAAAGIAVNTSGVDADTGKTVVKSYRELGKTGLKMSDISFGCGRLPSSSLVLRAIDRGINYFDTAPDYGKSEENIGGAMNKIQREKIIIASKFCTFKPYPGHLPLGSKKNEYIASVEGSLSRLKTDYLDIVFVHAIGESHKDVKEAEKRLLDNEMLSAFETLKKTGKVRFLAVSSHGPNNMEHLLLKAVNSGYYDLIMPAFNFMKFPNVPQVIKEAKEKNVGVVAMKTLAGAKEMDLDLKGKAFEPSVFKWVLKHSEISGLVITIKTVSDLDLFLQASGQPFTAEDRKVLDLYAAKYGKEYCRTGCSDCEPLCPNGVDIASIMRYHMYFKDYGAEKRAMTAYRTVKNNAEGCAACKTKRCMDACTYGLPVREMLIESHENLSSSI